MTPTTATPYSAIEEAQQLARWQGSVEALLERRLNYREFRGACKAYASGARPLEFALWLAGNTLVDAEWPCRRPRTLRRLAFAFFCAVAIMAGMLWYFGGAF